MREYMKLSVYARQHGITYHTAWKHYRAGRIPGYQDSDTGTIYIEKRDDQSATTGNRVALYARVSSTTNKNSLDEQLERLRLYAAAKGYEITSENTEIASGLNENRRILWGLLNNPQDWDILLAEHKDRITRFGYAYIDALVKEKGKQLVIINETEPKDKTQELMEDFISIVTSFCLRIYGSQRKKKTQRIIEAIHEQEET